MKSNRILFMLLLYIIHIRCAQMDNSTVNRISIYNPQESEKRLLQNVWPTNMRIHFENVDSTKSILYFISLQEKLLNVAKTFFENFLKVIPVSGIQFPSNGPLTCNGLSIPTKYISGNPNSELVEADFGILYGNANIDSNIFSGLTCVQYNGSGSNSMRPIWGAGVFNIRTMMSFNQRQIEDWIFQDLMSFIIRQFIHMLAFSASLYETFPNPSFRLNLNEKGQFQFSSSQISNFIKRHFNCSDPNAVLTTEDMEGATNYWDQYLIGNQIMLPYRQLIYYFGEITVTLFEATGWYPGINRNFIEPTAWGKNKGCTFLEQRNCDFEEFTPDSQLGSTQCDFSHLFSGLVIDSPYSNCKFVLLSSDGLCYSNRYGIKQNTGEIGGSSSRCFNGNIHKQGTLAPQKNTRCYQFQCINDGQYLAIKIGSSLQICLSPGQIISDVKGFDGTLHCPKYFNDLCHGKKICPYGCGTTGICINGKCLCVGNEDCGVSPSKARLLFQEELIERALIVEEAIKCRKGEIFDPVSQECLSCSEWLSCQICDNMGCVQCDDGSEPVKRRCN